MPVGVVDRIVDKIDFDGPDGCWLWLGHLTKGYGRFQDNFQRGMAHRVVYERFVEPVPEGLELDHLCRNRGCVNPDHLEAVTHSINVRRGDMPKRNGEKTHCKHGHEFTEENTYRHRGARNCKTCFHDSYLRGLIRKRGN
jgi:hypothetical protein